MLLLMTGAPIFWRVVLDNDDRSKDVYGKFTDLKTFRGANRRLMRKYPSWQQIESRAYPFHGATPNA